jgi:D-serine deaminase-like pyridoxal phosphate-dependent protein
VNLDALPTPCLLLDPAALDRNVAAMNGALARHGVPLRQHVKTAKCVAVAERAGKAHGRAITVSTLAEAEAFVAAGWDDVLYAVGLVPQKVPRLMALATRAMLTAVVDSAEVVARIAREVPLSRRLRLLIEIDVGQHRAGVSPDGPELLAIAHAIQLEPSLALGGVMAHAGHGYDAEDRAALVRIAEDERGLAVRAAERLRQAGFAAPIVSIGSTPTALFAESLTKITEVRAGVYVFQDLFQSSLGCAPKEDVAVSVLTTVIGVHGDRVLLDAGGIALSKDRSMDGRGPVAGGVSVGGYGEVRRKDGSPIAGSPIVHAVNQEHGFVHWPGASVQVGDRLRVLPNHVCMTAAQHDGYHVVQDGTVTAYWPRIRGF